LGHGGGSFTLGYGICIWLGGCLFLVQHSRKYLIQSHKASGPSDGDTCMSIHVSLAMQIKIRIGLDRSFSLRPTSLLAQKPRMHPGARFNKLMYGNDRIDGDEH
jgi:hypothetical protein